MRIFVVCFFFVIPLLIVVISFYCLHFFVVPALSLRFLFAFLVFTVSLLHFLFYWIPRCCTFCFIDCIVVMIFCCYMSRFLLGMSSLFRFLSFRFVLLQFFLLLLSWFLFTASSLRFSVFWMTHLFRFVLFCYDFFLLPRCYAFLLCFFLSFRW